MGEPTMEYMTKTREDYGSRIVRPKFDKDNKPELKGQFFKELHDNTFSGSENEDANKHIERVFKIVDLFTTPDVTHDQLMLCVFPITLMGTASRWLRNELEVIMFYKGLDVPTRQIIDSKGAIPNISVVDAKKAIQEMVDHSKKRHIMASTRSRSNNTYDGLAAIQVPLNNLGREIKKVNKKVYVAQIRRNHEMVDLDPTIEEGEFTDEPMEDVVKTRHDNEIIEGIDEYPIVIDFAFGENMDAYRDRDTGDVIDGKQFCKNACVKAKWFDGLITIHNGNDSVTYQMARSHPRFKHLSNEQCNKILPLLKVSARDKLEGKLHPYQKQKRMLQRSLEFGTRIHKGREEGRMAHT
nr:hypothetical protein [Tanacetum cinerariifolium]